VGTLYPEYLKNEQFLDYYSRSFGLNFVEITFPFYAIPEPETTARIAENADENLCFSIRLFKDLLKERLEPDKIKAFRDGVAPLLETGRVKCWLADFHHTLTASQESLKRIMQLKEAFSDLPFFAELPSRTWHKDKQIDDLRRESVGFVVMDTPHSPKLPPFKVCAPNMRAYFRLYGRNKKWTEPAKKIPDYSYIKPELEEIKHSMETIAPVSKEVFVSFCNVVKGQGAFNAKYFAGMINKDNED
jgi:uncharacterized protein YecE (DUF72 family)